MDLLQEHLFERLLTRYEKRFGDQPDITVTTVDDAVQRMRHDLAAMPPPRQPSPMSTHCG
ncbi:MAG: hypothetical protein AB7F67_17365 [Rhodospirillaceae bacterium]